MNQESYKDSEFWTPEVSFLGEQDGSPERELKSILSKLFKSSDQIQLAYLARVSYGDQEESIALCLKTEPNIRQEDVMSRIAEIFSNLFSQGEQLDIVFLTENNAAQISKVCQPFFIHNLT